MTREEFYEGNEDIYEIFRRKEIDADVQRIIDNSVSQEEEKKTKAEWNKKLIETSKRAMAGVMISAALVGMVLLASNAYEEKKKDEAVANYGPNMHAVVEANEMDLPYDVLNNRPRKDYEADGIAHEIIKEDDVDIAIYKTYDALKDEDLGDIALRNIMDQIIASIKSQSNGEISYESFRDYVLYYDFLDEKYDFLKSNGEVNYKAYNEYMRQKLLDLYKQTQGIGGR